MKTTIPFNLIDTQKSNWVDKLFGYSYSGVFLHIEIEINNKKANMLLDTGASTTGFDINMIKSFSPKLVDYFATNTGLGVNQEKAQVAIIQKIKIGEIELLNYKSVLCDLCHIHKFNKTIGISSVDGVLGSDILNRYKAIIDYSTKTLTLFTPTFTVTTPE